MLIKVKTITGFGLNSLDGDFGEVEQIYFDDHHWVVHYLVADTGSWLAGKRVLISPYALRDVHQHKRKIDVALTKKQIEDCPPITTDQPISLQYEQIYYAYHGWPGRWGLNFPTHGNPRVVREADNSLEPVANPNLWDPHLRSTDKVRGYHVGVNKEWFGHIVDFVLEDVTWALRYLIVDTSDFWPGKKLLISTQWVDQVNWGNSTVDVGLTREQIMGAPKYSEELLLRRDYEVKLHSHYNRQGYWEILMDAQEHE